MKEPKQTKKEKIIRGFCPPIICATITIYIIFTWEYYIHNNILLLSIVAVVHFFLVLFLVKYFINKYYEKKEQKRIRKLKHGY